MGKFTALAIGLVLGLASAACGGETGSDAETTVVQAGESFAEVPAHDGDVVLTITGATGTPNDGDAISFDLATLERLRLERWTLFEPFLDEDVDFVGVPMQVLLEVVGVPEGATEVSMLALDDYKVQIPLTAIEAGETLLATQGATPGLIPVEEGGPIRLVFATSSETGLNPDLWIWSIRHMEIQ